MLTTDDIGGLRVGDGFLQRSANCNILTKNITYPIQKINKLFVRLIICVSSINFLSFRPSIINNEFPIGYIFSNEAIDALEEYSTKLAKSVMKRAEAICRNFDATNINIEKIFGTGEAKYVICNAAKNLEADTLVMGSHGYGFFKRALLGSVSDYCVKNAKCPVVIVKQP